jgi:serine-type D-Ala-D-Ala carboxypeptidase (penicillin-binding protein 5/6)
MAALPFTGRRHRSAWIWLVAVVLTVAGPAPATRAQAVEGDLQITAAGAVLWDPLDDRVLYGVAEDVARPMASTTKIMTVLLAIEAGMVDDVLTVSEQAARQGGASLDLTAGQTIPVRSIVAGLLLRSGNDGALALAEHVAGSEEAFVARMNARAAELGLHTIRFVNASGLTDDPGHRASPLDLARLAAVAMAHPVFAEYAGAARATVPGLAPMESRNELLGRYPGATGVKTGFTSLAGFALVASAEREGRVLYATVLGSEDSFGDATILLDHGFTAWARPVVLVPDLPVATYRWAEAAVPLVAAETLTATVPSGADLAWRARLAPGASRPVAAGSRLGSAQLLVDGEVVREVPLEAAEAVAETGHAGAAAAVGAAVHEALRAFVRAYPIDRPVSIEGPQSGT